MLDIKTKVDDYATDTVEISADGEAFELEVRSLLSREFKNAQAEYLELLNHAKENDIALEETVDDDKGLGITVKVKRDTEYKRKCTAIMLSKLVVNWPFDDDLAEAIYESEALRTVIDVTATSLMVEFNSKKKT